VLKCELRALTRSLEFKTTELTESMRFIDTLHSDHKRLIRSLEDENETFRHLAAACSLSSETRKAKSTPAGDKDIWKEVADVESSSRQRQQTLNNILSAILSVEKEIDRLRRKLRKEKCAHAAAKKRASLSETLRSRAHTQYQNLRDDIDNTTEECEYIEGCIETLRARECRNMSFST